MYWHAYGPPDGREPLLHALIRADAKLEARSHGRFTGAYTPLACAVLAQRPDLIRALLDGGADPRRKSKYRMTTLEAANSSPAIRALLKAHLKRKPTPLR